MRRLLTGTFILLTTIAAAILVSWCLPEFWEPVLLVGWIGGATFMSCCRFRISDFQGGETAKSVPPLL